MEPIPDELEKFLAAHGLTLQRQQSCTTPMTIQHSVAEHHSSPSGAPMCSCVQCQRQTQLPQTPAPSTSTALQHVQQVISQYKLCAPEYPIQRAYTNAEFQGLAAAFEHSLGYTNARLQSLESSVNAVTRALIQTQTQGMQQHAYIGHAPQASQIHREESMPPASASPDTQASLAELKEHILKMEGMFAQLGMALIRIENTIQRGKLLSFFLVWSRS